MLPLSCFQLRMCQNRSTDDHILLSYSLSAVLESGLYVLFSDLVFPT